MQTPTAAAADRPDADVDDSLNDMRLPRHQQQRFLVSAARALAGICGFVLLAVALLPIRGLQGLAARLSAAVGGAMLGAFAVRGPSEKVPMWSLAAA